MNKHKNLQYLNANIKNCIRERWIIEYNNGIAYVAIDQTWKIIKYFISGYQKNMWNFYVRILNNENEWTTITNISSSKKHMSFEKFVKQIVEPIIRNATYEEERVDLWNILD